MSETDMPTANVAEEMRHKSDEGVRIESILYPLAILAAIFTWFFAVRYPLWLDETVSYWQISGGFSQLWPRRGNTLAYPYILWIAKSVFGTSVLALRLPSILAMLGATAIFYRTAKQLLGYGAANISTVIFCIHPAVVFAAIDVRPYAFAILATILTIQFIVRWVESSATRDAALFGIGCAIILYFRLVFVLIIPIFVLYLLIEAKRRAGTFRPKWKAAIVPFAILFLPVAKQIYDVLTTPKAHVFSERPTIDELALAFAPDFLLALFAVTMLLAAAVRKIANPSEQKPSAPSLVLLIGLVPLLGLFLLSVLTPIHMFIGRYYLSAIPGVALCWGMMASWIDCKWLRAGFCAMLAVASLAINYNPSFSASHGYTWKFAIDAAEVNTARDHAPILMCSGIIESNLAEGPIAPGSALLPQLSYYPLSSPVVGLPYSFTPEARREIDEFLQQAALNKQRFLMVGWTPSYDSIHYAIEKSDPNFEAYRIGIFDNVAVVEFRPK